MLKVSHITSGYGKKQVLSDVSFEVAGGDIVLLTGGNGSGKSTILKTIFGLLKPWTQEGKIIFDDHDITATPVSARIRRGIVYMPQKRNVFDDFTVEENLLTSAARYPKAESRERAERVYGMLPLLGRMRKRTPFHMSGGERQVLAFGNAVVHSPKLFLLDEPFAGADAANTEVLRNCIDDLNEKGAAFIVVEHKRQLIDGVANKVIELELGGIKR
ncbi:MAG: ATP-binding cassette domain-containing protein [Phycisphaerales bacterium]|nr:ATP-binding cassette domain-containing protein [Phycisphaerales bacterium]